MKFRKLLSLKSIPGTLSILWVIYNNTGKIVSYAGDIDFIIERTKDIAWIGVYCSPLSKVKIC
jgi:hypothetical protein